MFVLFVSIRIVVVFVFQVFLVGLWLFLWWLWLCLRLMNNCLLWSRGWRRLFVYLAFLEMFVVGYFFVLCDDPKIQLNNSFSALHLGQAAVLINAPRSTHFNSFGEAVSPHSGHVY